MTLEVIEAQDLINIINKLENLEKDKQDLNDVIKETCDEAKAKGYDVNIIKHVLKLKKKDKGKLAEEDSLVELYRSAIGI